MKFIKKNIVFIILLVIAIWIGFHEQGKAQPASLVVWGIVVVYCILRLYHNYKEDRD